MESVWFWKPVWMGMLRSAAVLTGGILVTVLLIHRLSGPVYYISPWIYGLLIVAAFAGGHKAAKASRQHGWLQGLIVGTLLGFFSVSFWSLAGTYPIVEAVSDLLSLLGFGLLGGIVGVYRQDKRRVLRRGQWGRV
ncbi:TIGR04086 family membrane protein [Heliobacterium chlorum]|uniref:TIGR04086 family membrane protein n=1 Tax=Heliobacterium chlorum TaxID=2698 RepID=A0ABR7T0V2_HELCL|nr:TIGR04086 family membrane protein [Heliobacterium chlorum]MBC9783930.1 TIGR04086 family membrane protein [Heliobacterium chlorum]